MEYEIDKDVVVAVRDERRYQNRRWGTIEKHPHEVGGYLTIMRSLMTEADAGWSSSGGDYAALDAIRKVVAVGIACMEQHGAVTRSTLAFLGPAPSKDIHK